MTSSLVILDLVIQFGDQNPKKFFPSYSYDETSQINTYKCKIFYFESISFSLVAQMVKNLPIMQEMWVWSLGQEGRLEKGMAAHSSILI